MQSTGLLRQWGTVLLLLLVDVWVFHDGLTLSRQSQGGVAVVSAGVARLKVNLKSWFPRSVRPIPFGRMVTNLPKVDHLLIDMNCLLHQTCGHKESNADRMVETMQKTLGRELQKQLRLFKPSKSLVLAIDGVAPFAKVQTQRLRRQCDDIACHLSPGTELMMAIENVTVTECQRLMGLASNISTPCNVPNSIFYSSSGHPGEGECKLQQWLVDFPNTKFRKPTALLVGSDSDLIVQALLLTDRFQVFVVGRDARESNCWNVNKLFYEIRQQVEGLAVAKGNHTAESTQSKQAQSEQPSLVDEHQLRYDLVVLFGLMGNDYLPPLPGMSRQHLFDDYAECMKSLPTGERYLYDTATKMLNCKAMAILMQRMLKRFGVAHLLPSPIQFFQLVTGTTSKSAGNRLHDSRIDISWTPTAAMMRSNSTIESSKEEGSKEEDSKDEESEKEGSKEEDSNDEESEKEGSQEEDSQDEDSKEEDSKEEDSREEESKEEDDNFESCEADESESSATNEVLFANQQPLLFLELANGTRNNRVNHSHMKAALAIRALQLLFPSAMKAFNDLYARQLAFLKTQQSLGHVDKSISLRNYQTRYDRWLSLAERVTVVNETFLSQLHRNLPEALPLQLFNRWEPSESDVINYLSGLSWLVQLYSTGQCNDYSFSHNFRSYVSPLHIYSLCRSQEDDDLLSIRIESNSERSHPWTPSITSLLLQSKQEFVSKRMSPYWKRFQENIKNVPQQEWLSCFDSTNVLIRRALNETHSPVVFHFEQPHWLLFHRSGIVSPRTGAYQRENRERLLPANSNSTWNVMRWNSPWPFAFRRRATEYENWQARNSVAYSLSSYLRNMTTAAADDHL